MGVNAWPHAPLGPLQDVAICGAVQGMGLAGWRMSLPRLLAANDGESQNRPGNLIDGGVSYNGSLGGDSWVDAHIPGRRPHSRSTFGESCSHLVRCAWSNPLEMVLHRSEPLVLATAGLCFLQPHGIELNQHERRCEAVDAIKH